MIILILTILGLCFGSFVNALVWRMYQQDFKSKKDKKLSILHGRSMCTHCKNKLEAIDLIPVLSWVILRGKCRYCHKKIEDNPFTEILAPTFFVFSYLYWPFELTGINIVGFISWLVILVGFVALIKFDINWKLLPNKILVWLYPFVILLASTELLRSGLTLGEIIGLLSSIFVGGGIFYILFQISKGNWIGGGDVKLGFLVGLLLHRPELSALWIFIAACLGSLFSIPLLIADKKNKSKKIPFGPFLIVSAVIVKLFGVAMVDWYMKQLSL